MDCPECDEELYTIKGLCTDSEGFREDKFCPECNIRFGLRRHGLVKIASLKENKTEIIKKKVINFDS